jgi:hypothetical protein
MLALAVLFGLIAVDDKKWGLLAAMVVLALTALALFLLQWRLLRRLNSADSNDQTRG